MTPPAPTVRVDPAIASRFEGVGVVALHARGLVNGPSDDASRAALADAVASARALHPTGRPADHPHLAAWRAAYSAFGAKPSRYPCSVEALTARALKTGELPAVNRVVDAYNAVSVRHVLPVGGEDAARFAGAARLTVAGGEEAWDGPDADGAVPAGEVVWRDDAGVTCRRWNWRQGRRTQITEATTDALFLLEALPPFGAAAMAAVVDDLSARLRALGATVAVETLAGATVAVEEAA